jgi:uncharacterized protein (TIGR04168 family)
MPCIKIAIVGDIHDQWESADADALHALGVDLVLFVGDFGNESIDIVKAVASLDLPKAAIFGNHDAWYSATKWGKDKCPYDRSREDRVQQQLDILGAAHVGYGQLDFPQLGLGVVGSRPFSWGGSEWKNRTFYRDRFGITSFAESRDQMVRSAQASTQNTLLFIGHNGPTGLGSAPEDPCGKDWGSPIGGDYGDPDFEQALTATRFLGKNIPLVTFGHMHQRLRHRQDQSRRVAVYAENTLYLNAACAPRIVAADGQVYGRNEWQGGADRRRNFSVVTLVNGVVAQAALVWLDRSGVVSEQVLYDQAGSRAELIPTT